MLLHVIKPAWPIDTTFDHSSAFRRRALNHVKYAVVTVVNALDHTRSIQGSGVARLSTAGRVKGGAIQNYSGPTAYTFGYVNDSSFKLDEMRIVIVETFGRHRGCLVFGLRSWKLIDY
jgi:hypothetical protein